jgi:hypothetical protein
MQSAQPIRSEERISAPLAIRIAARGIGLLWALVRWPLILVLAALEPFVRAILYGFGILGALAALFLRYLGHRPDVPLVTVFAVSLGCLAAAALYRGLLRFLAYPADAGR